ncbi:MAG: FHA domain-containing protein [Myxococcales bacterium]
MAPLDATVVQDRASAAGPAQPPRLLVVGGTRSGAVIMLGADELTVGRGWDNDVVLPDISVSRRHALLRRHGNGYLLLDLGSGNGTRVNGWMVAKARLHDGDEIALGDSVVQFVEAGGAAVRGTGARRQARSGGRRLRRLVGSRGAAYGAMAALVVAATALGGWRWYERDREARERSEQRLQIRAIARHRFAEGASLLEEGRWEEASGKLELAAELDPGGPQVHALLERAAAETSRARALAEARAALARMDFAGAKLRIAGVPEDSALAMEAREVAVQLGRALEDAVRGARARASTGDRAAALKLLDAVLAAEPARADALELKASASAPVARAPAARRVRPAASALPRIVEAYLRGDVDGALQLARGARADPATADMLARLERFASAWRQGLSRMEEDRTADAIAALDDAEAADRAVAPGREGALTRQVRTALSRLHTRMAAGLVRDEELAAAAAHLRIAVAQDAANEAAREQLRQLVGRVEEAYLRGYVAKDGDGEAARQAFRLVVAALPPTDDTALKARRWLDRLDGKNSEEEPPAAAQR